VPAAAAAAALLRRETSLTFDFVIMTSKTISPLNIIRNSDYDYCHNCAIFAFRTGHNYVHLPAGNNKHKIMCSQLILNSSFCVTSRGRHGSRFDDGHLQVCPRLILQKALLGKLGL
jgi:hypothetical protein